MPPPTASSALSPAAPPSPPKPPLRNAERIAADRQRITDGDVLGILLDHLRGRIELSQTQVNTGFSLLKKILPDFSNSAPPRDDEENRDDDASSIPEFEVHIVDPKQA